jgi:hypothetical protein
LLSVNAFHAASTPEEGGGCPFQMLSAAMQYNFVLFISRYAVYLPRNLTLSLYQRRVSRLCANALVAASDGSLHAAHLQCFDLCSE